jgi:hypothetical protein
VPDDYWAAGTFGDIVLKNDRCTLIFGGMNPKKPNPERDGLLIDAFPNARAQEHFWRSYPITGDVNTRTVETTNVELINDEEEGIRPPCRHDEVQRSTRTSRSRPSTSCSATGPAQARHDDVSQRMGERTRSQLPAIGEFVHWGVMSPFIPSVGFAAAGAVDADAEFIYGNYFDDFLFLMPTEGFDEGKAQPLRNTPGVQGSRRDSGRWRRLDFTRHLLTSTDTMAPLLGEALANREGKPFGYLSGKIIERAHDGNRR